MTAGGEPAGDELLGTPRPLPRRVRQAGFAVAALLVAVGIAVVVWPDQHHSRAVAAWTSRSVPSSAPVPPPASSSASTRPWPSARQACDGTTDLPLVQGARPIRRATGVAALVGGSRIARVSFDSGRAEWLPRSLVRRDEYVSSISDGFALVANCRGSEVGRPRLLRLTGTGAVPVRMGHRIDYWLVDGSHQWGVRWPTAPNGSSTLFPAGGGPAVRLPARFYAWAITDGVAVGNFGAADGPGPLVLVDAATGAIRENLGAGEVLAAANGVLVWTTGCDITTNQSCTAHRRAIAGGPTTKLRLPRSPAFSIGVISPDGTTAACALERARPDRRFAGDHPFPPAEIAVLHFGTDSLDIVPGIELPAKSSAALSFTRSGWLVVGLNAGTRIRLLLWRPGMRHLLEASALPGLANTPPGMQLLPPVPHHPTG